MNNFHEILDCLGGRRHCMLALGIGSSAISNWRREGIPRSRWPDLIELGKQRGINEAKVLQALRRLERNRTAAKSAA
jgi:hypothetical protein